MVEENVIVTLARIEEKLVVALHHLEAHDKTLYGEGVAPGLKAIAQDNATRIAVVEKHCADACPHGFWGFFRPVAQDVTGKVIVGVVAVFLLLAAGHQLIGTLFAR